MNVVKRSGQIAPLDIEKIHAVTSWACKGLNVSQSELEIEAHLMLFDGIKTTEIHKALITSAATLVSLDSPDYTFVASRLLLQTIFKRVTGGEVTYPSMAVTIDRGIKEGQYSSELQNGFDFAAIDNAMVPERDLLLNYMGLQTLVDRYLVRERAEFNRKGNLIELPQHFWMRVAMGLSLKEIDRTAKAIEFYNVLSSLEFISSTPTLFNSGSVRSQMSSCYLNTVSDSLEGIYGTITECAQLSKFSGGIGTDWTRVRGKGDVIKGTNGLSSGVVPFLKIYNDTAVAVNQGGKRLGAFAPYMEPWHPDFLEFIDLKKNTGDERRRTHDIFPAAWFPDLFFERVEANALWSFFSPAETPSLHESHGEDFKAKYEQLESEGKFRSQIKAVDLWKKVITSLFETGHPWVTFKDECNRRNPQAHQGYIHSSNLCTEITLNTSDEETAVCNLGSVNLARIKDNDHLAMVIKTGVRMLDNVIDLNFYPSEKARLSNFSHRAIGLGVMGYTEFLIKNGVDWESQEHLELANSIFERISYYAIDASIDLAKERGTYPSYEGSTWSKGIVPLDTAKELANGLTTGSFKMGWDSLRLRMERHGVRNSNLMAIAPTATIALIAGTTQCVEPIFKRSFTEDTLSGSFLVVDPTLACGRPELCKEAFEIDPSWVIKAAAVRQKWLDQSQSVNIFVKANITGPELSNIYIGAWKLGLKTTYYLRNQSQEIKKTALKETVKVELEQPEPEPKVCPINAGPDCESCQ